MPGCERSGTRTERLTVTACKHTQVGDEVVIARKEPVVVEVDEVAPRGDWRIITTRPARKHTEQVDEVLVFWEEGVVVEVDGVADCLRPAACYVVEMLEVFIERKSKQQRTTGRGAARCESGLRVDNQRLRNTLCVSTQGGRLAAGSFANCDRASLESRCGDEFPTLEGQERASDNPLPLTGNFQQSLARPSRASEDSGDTNRNNFRYLHALALGEHCMSFLGSKSNNGCAFF
jgi:hypothetical protein